MSTSASSTPMKSHVNNTNGLYESSVLSSAASTPEFRPRSPSVLLHGVQNRRMSRSWSSNALMPGQSRYAQKHATANSFAAIERVFNVEALVSDLKNIYTSEESKQGRYAGFLFHAIGELRFSTRTVDGIRKVMIALQTELDQQEIQKHHYGESLDLPGRDSDSTEEALMFGELVLLCLACITELEIVFNATVSLADDICRNLRYWKHLRGKPWRFEVNRGPERIFNREAFPLSCEERISKLEHVLVNLLRILGVTKRFMRNMQDHCPDGSNFKRQYGGLMGWAAEGFHVLQEEIGGATVTNESLVDVLRRSSRAFMRESSSVGSNLNRMSEIPEDDEVSDGNGGIHDIRSLGFSSPVSRDGGPRVMGVAFAGALMLNIGELIASVPKFQDLQRQRYAHLQKPNWLLRRWPEWTVAAGGAFAGIVYARKIGLDRAMVVEYADKFKISVEEFFAEHVTEPLTTLFKEIFFDDYGDMTDPQEIEDSKQLLISSLKEYHTTRALADKAGYIGALTNFVGVTDQTLPDHVVESIHQDSHNMRMDTVMKTMEIQMRDPKKNLISGDVIELMLLQALYMKKEMMVAMGKVDRLLKANQFNLEVMALVPAVMVGASIYSSAKYILMRFGSVHLRVNTQFELRMTLRDIEQTLNKVANFSNMSISDGSELYRMEPADLGLLALLLHRFDELLHIHFYLNNTDAEEQVRMEEDLEELMSEELGVVQRVHVVHRLCRYFPNAFQETRLLNKW
jgi:hypothetical protein